MMLIVGLGNPGEKFKGTRHNIGREVLIEWHRKAGLPDFEFDKKLNALVSKIPPIPPFSKGGRGGILLLPETMMNKSGNAVKPVLRAFKVKPKDIVVLHDDADIELGRVKLSFAKHSAGHKGVESVKRALGTWNFWRLRVGIQKKKRVDAMKLVLQKFAPAEETTVKNVKKKLALGINMIAEEGPKKAMNEINRN